MNERNGRIPPGPPNMLITSPSLPRGCLWLWMGFLMALLVVLVSALIVDVYLNGW